VGQDLFTLPEHLSSPLVCPFRRCMNLYPNLARMLYDACRRDVCLNYNDKAFVHRLACGYVEQMAPLVDGYRKHIF
jgi:hypothetical protein